MSALDSIRQRAENATPGPWQFDNYGWLDTPGPFFVISPGPYDHYEVQKLQVQPADAEFIAAARTDIPRLLAALDAVEALCANVPDVQGHDCKFEGILLPSQVRAAITQAIGDPHFDEQDSLDRAVAVRCKGHKYRTQPSGRGIGFDEVCTRCGFIRNRRPVY